ncbi:quinone-dependent dihydroorotate dehydrogenase [Beggiatoa leptomitoformis]|uniref:Dihydroorotate dehydrogenase (quinone) n=1 Tax=Beggiatoa leptomitoformis TaxID=288004 RepID=A0A2N9YJS1_9GAMM|nr:quinone-dependent dihydroorotate dehydrogenase [Beggiatoa leptomitoformis]ALG69450.1 quinone-dependent dihydroorotate dehydrogenase [Beggiatoa leptomitoformis]AUI70635.1 quinone-dependent dihydroorotate dehydrogenase [Beggiatoa leptomitoformis]
MHFYPLYRPVLFSLPPETAHHFTLSVLQRLSTLKLSSLLFPTLPAKPCQVMGLNFPNPVGLAAGLDKNGEYIDGLASLGFGFVEIGTITPRPQAGNPQPRLFRLPQARALINRLGFNNAGVDALIANVEKAKFTGILGINIGKNATTPLENAVDDYLFCLRKVYAYADYVTVNISSPNTANLRQLQHGDELDRLLSTLKQAQRELADSQQKYVPLVVKIAPDLTREELQTIAEKLLYHQIDGVIATNTTLARQTVEDLPYASEAGGLSGQPLTQRATAVVADLYPILQDKIPIIAVGGIMSAEDAQAKFQAGAKLVQLYTGLIYEGAGLVQAVVCHSTASSTLKNR